MALRKSKATRQPAWRPNFRNAETLPDIKIVRTDFIINLTAISVAVALLVMVIYREYHIAKVEEAVAITQQNIDLNIAADRRNVRLSNEFQKVERTISELPQFLNVPLSPDTLVRALASMQPPEMILVSLSFSPTVTRQGRKETVRYQIVLNGRVTDGTVDGQARAATDIITDYRNAFGNLDLLAPYFLSSELSGFSRNEAQGSFNFTIRVTLSMEANAKS